MADFTIGQATPTLSVTDAGGTYSASAFPATDATVSGVGTDGTIAAFGDPSLSYTYYAGTYATLAALEAASPSALGSAPVAAGSYTVMATYAGNANYTPASGVADFTIGQATPTVSVTDAGGTYSTSVFPATDATVTGVGTDGTIAAFGDPSLSYTYYAGSYATVAALEAASPSALGSAPLAVGSYTVMATYAGNANYTSASSVADFTIGQATPTVTVTDASGSYTSVAFSAAGFVQGVSGTNLGTPIFTYYSGTHALQDLSGLTPLSTAPVDVGNYTVLASYSGSVNYTTASALATFTISPKDVTVTTQNAGKTYGNSDPSPLTSADLSGFYAIDNITATFVRVPGENVGTYGITTTLVGSAVKLGDYDVTNAGAMFTIAARPITVTANSGQSKVYGNADPTLFTYQITSGNLMGNDALSGVLSRVAGENVGPYQITQNTLTAGANYSLTYVPTNFTITTRAITVTAAAGQSKIYGQNDPTFAYSITSGNLVRNDSLPAAD